ncbi:Leucine efflux protein [Chlamydiales bacterium SCGC AG-110-M15]|nr:Leucine efflux protein [Chlamydiales bacterium SCGC AG-110-M15]
MGIYWDELITVSFIVFLAAMSPGPDWAIVAKNSLTVSRYAGLWSAFGIAVAILVHMAYCVFGVAVIIDQSPVLFNVIKYLGAAYLCYIGIKEIRAKAHDKAELQNKKKSKNWSVKQAFREGFITNLLNPKAALFFLSLFTIVIDPGTPILILLLYAIVVVGITLIWFCTLAFALSSRHISERFIHYQHWIERVLGAALIMLGLFVAVYG